MMKVGLGSFFAILAATGLAALAGGFAVFCAYDDAPGGVLMAIVMVLGATLIALKTVSNARRARA